MKMTPIRLLSLMFWLTMGPAFAAEPLPQQDAQDAAAAAPAAALAPIQVDCVRVLDRSDAAAARPAAADSCARRLKGTLVGTGDVEVGMTPASYRFVTAYEAKNDTRAVLYVNGVPLGDDAQLVSVRQFPDTVFLRYNIMPGVHSKLLWAALYRMGPTVQAHPLSAAVGFDRGPLSDNATGSPVDIAITSGTHYRAGVILVVALAIAGLALGYATDIFRDGSLPPALRLAVEMKRRTARGIGAPAEEKALLELDPDYTADQRAACVRAARDVLAGADPALADAGRLAAGLFLLRADWRVLKPTYSLGRVQLGLWTLFAVAAGAYLWVIYGVLPELDGSLLVLLGLSAATTTLALATDQDNPNVRFSLSRGFVNDLVTGWDDKQQLHRFQAVVVNLLLLLVGLSHVVTHLAYPIFSPNWLTLLGISGLGLAAGKKYVETQPASPQDSPLAGAVPVTMAPAGTAPGTPAGTRAATAATAEVEAPSTS